MRINIDLCRATANWSATLGFSIAPPVGLNDGQHEVPIQCAALSNLKTVEV